MYLPARVRRSIGLALFGLILIPAVASSQSVERIVYASVLDQAGTPVSDLAVRDFVVRESSGEREVLRVSPATEPLDVAVLVDTSQAVEPFVTDLRRGLTEFVKTIGTRHQIALIGFGERPTALVDYTRDMKRVTDGANRLFAHTGSGAYLMDGLVEVSRGLRKRENTRRTVVVIASEGQEFSNRYSSDVLDEVRESGARIDVFVITERPGSLRGRDASQQDVSASTSLQDPAAQQRAIALNEAPRLTGGRRDDLVSSMGLGARLRELANELNNQYRVVYARPGALIPPTSIEVQIRRSELRVRATRIPPK
jgi:VWFA-related protein